MGDVKIHGVKELSDKLGKYSEQVMKNRLRAMTKAVLMIERDAKKLVPVDRGRLRASITSDIKQEGSKLKGFSGNIKGEAAATRSTSKRTGRVVKAGVASTKYGVNVEYGIGQPAQPFLRPALIKNKEKIKDLFKEVLKFR